MSSRTPTESSSRARPWQGDALLLLAAMIWGAAFVAQRAGMEHVGPMTFNGVRFALGSVALWPLCARARAASQPATPAWPVGLLAGLVLFIGATLQQLGLVETTAGKAGFITGLYVVLVPVLGLGLGRRVSPGVWLGAALAVAGLYGLCVNGPLTIGRGDLLELVGALFWAVHIHVLDRAPSSVNPYRLAAIQSAVCSVASLATAVALEPIHWAGLRAAAVPILYGGLMSVAVAYTLQVVAQRRAAPTHAAILLSLEAVFAALAGWAILHETLSHRAVVGCGLMLAGMWVSQLANRPR